MPKIWEVYWPADGVEFLNDKSGKPHMMLIVSSGYRFNYTPFFTFVPLSNDHKNDYCVSVPSAAIKYSPQGTILSHTTHALCGLIYTAGYKSFGKPVGELIYNDVKDDIIEAIRNRLAIP